MTITPVTFRGMIWLGICLSTVSMLFDKVFASQIPSALRDLDAKIHQGSTTALLPLAIFALICLAIVITSLVGLYQFKPWARTLTLSLYPLSLLFALLAQSPISYTLSPMFTSCLSEAAQAVGGAVLAIAYFAPSISTLFDNHVLRHHAQGQM